MKLYATVTSERASKGQGGKEIEIKVKDENKETIAIMRFTPDSVLFQFQQQGWVTSHYNQSGETFSFTSFKKGEKQKGEQWPCDGDDISCPKHTKH